jgi:hypothetical protein
MSTAATLYRPLKKARQKSPSDKQEIDMVKRTVPSQIFSRCDDADDQPAKLWTPHDSIPVDFREAVPNPNQIMVVDYAKIEIAVLKWLMTGS